MRRIFILTAIIMSIGLLAMQAQEKNVRAGVGVSLSTDMTGLGYYYFYGLSWHSVPSIRFPVEFGKKFRIEPELGLMTYSSKSVSSSNNDEDIYSFQGYRVGLSASYLMPNVGGKEYLQASIGGRLALHGFHTEDESPVGNNVVIREADRTDIGFGAFVGAEYFPVKEFSVGGEMGLSLVSAGETTRSPVNASYSSPDGLSTGLYASLHVRWFIF